MTQQFKLLPLELINLTIKSVKINYQLLIKLNRT